MKTFLLFLFICPLISPAQETLPRFENDTVYTSSGYKIYKGQILKFAKGTAHGNTFRFIRLASGWHEADVLTDRECVVKKLSRYNVTPLGNAYIFVLAQITYKDGSKGDINFNMAFDNAIEGYPGMASELIVPEEFQNTIPKTVSKEIARLYKLYQQGILTKEEFEDQKQKLLSQ
jgi:hypothetical protein